MNNISHNFKAHGSNNFIEIDDGYTQTTDPTDATETMVIGCHGYLFNGIVRTAAYQAKRAQDKTTVRKSEFVFRSDGLFLSQTAQPDNVLAVASIYFTDNAPWRVIRKDDRLDSTPPADGGANLFVSLQKGLEESTRGSAAPPPVRTCVARARSLESLCVAGTHTRHHHKPVFQSVLPNLAENITYDRLNRRTDAKEVGAHTTAASCDDLGAITSHNSNSGFGDSGAYGYVSGMNRLRGSAAPSRCAPACLEPVEGSKRRHASQIVRLFFKNFSRKTTITPLEFVYKYINIH